MQILNNEIERKITNSIVNCCLNKQFDLSIENISKIIDELYAKIPDNRRISYGRVHTVRVLSEYLFNHFNKIESSTFEIASNIFNKSEDFKTKGVALGILSFIGLNDYEKVLPFFESAASHENSYWIAYRACRNLIKKELTKVMDLLKVNEYKYKNRIYKRSDYQGN